MTDDELMRRFFDDPENPELVEQVEALARQQAIEREEKMSKRQSVVTRFTLTLEERKMSTSEMVELQEIFADPEVSKGICGELERLGFDVMRAEISGPNFHWLSLYFRAVGELDKFIKMAAAICYSGLGWDTDFCGVDVVDVPGHDLPALHDLLKGKREVGNSPSTYPCNAIPHTTDGTHNREAEVGHSNGNIIRCSSSRKYL